MVVAGFRHLASRDQDPQLHTHCVLANMTRTASGEWRSVEPTKIRRSQKLIGAYYRNELARRLQALGMAVAPRMVGPVPGFELAGYERSFIDAFSGRRRAILEYLEQKELPYTAENTQMAALHTRRRKEDRTLADLVPEWRARAQALGLVRERMALRPPRPLDPLTGEQVRVPRVPAPDLPANEIRSQKRAPALPKLPRDGVAEGAEARLTGAGFRAPAELSLKPERGVLEAVARAVAHVAERRTAVPEAEIRAVALGHAPGRYTLAEVDAAIARLVRDGELIEVERRGMDRAFVTDRAVKAERRVLASMRAGRGKGIGAGERGDGGEAARAVAPHPGPEGGGPHGAVVERPRDRRAGPCRQRQDDHAERGEGATRGAEDTGPGAVGRGRPGSRQGGRHPHADAAVLPDPLRRPLGPGAAGAGPGGVRGRGSGGGRGLDDRQRSHGGAAAHRARAEGGAGRAGGRHQTVEGGGCGPALPSAAEGGHGDGDDEGGEAPARPGAAGCGGSCPGRGAGRGDRGAGQSGAGGASGGARHRGGASLARAGAGASGGYPDPRPHARDLPAGERHRARGAGGGRRC